MPASNSPEYDKVTSQEFEDRLLGLCIRSGIKGLPRKQRDRHILFKSVVLTFDKAEEYTETGVNRQLRWWLSEVGRSLELDHVRLRRHLIDAEYLGRSKDGSRYWVAVFSRNHIPFDSAVEDIDVYTLVETRRAAQVSPTAGASKSPLR